MKKLLAALVASALAVSMMSVAAFATDYSEDPGYEDPGTESSDVECAAGNVVALEVTADIAELVVDVNFADAATDEAGTEIFAFNDWCGYGVIVTLADGTKTYYQWGGAQVTWDWDADGDEVPDSVGGVNGETWLGTVVDGAVTLNIPVAQGAIVEFYTLSWTDYEGTQYTLGIEEDTVTEYVDVWASYDLEAMKAANAEFVLGGALDIYAIVGDAWADIATVEATFTWTPGLGGWCGGAGIGNGATLADGTSWISGPEYGCANANSDCEPDGTATQVIMDITETPLATIYAIAEDGTVTFGQLMIQNWWNGTEAEAAVSNVVFKNAAGEVIGEISFVEENGGEGEGDNPDTGVALAVVPALVAAAAIVVSKKRK